MVSVHRMSMEPHCARPPVLSEQLMPGDDSPPWIPWRGTASPRGRKLLDVVVLCADPLAKDGETTRTMMMMTMMMMMMLLFFVIPEFLKSCSRLSAKSPILSSSIVGRNCQRQRTNTCFLL
jgi:hypothetical protein